MCEIHNVLYFNICPISGISWLLLAVRRRSFGTSLHNLWVHDESKNPLSETITIKQPSDFEHIRDVLASPNRDGQ